MRCLGLCLILTFLTTIVWGEAIELNDLSRLRDDGFLVESPVGEGVVEEVGSGFVPDGPCVLLWPLNGTEVFVHSFPMPTMQRYEKLVIECTLEGESQGALRLLVEAAADGEQQYYSLNARSGLFEVSYRAAYHSNRKIFQMDISVLADSSTSLPVAHFRVELVVVTGGDSVGEENSQCLAWKPGPIVHPMAATIDSRDDLGVALPLLVPNAFSWVELGVQAGMYADLILSTAPGLQHYVGIDPWIPQPRERYRDVANDISLSEHEANMHSALRRLDYHHRPDHKRTVTLLRKTSVDAARLFKNCSIDVVYVDGRHDYAGVLQDIEEWWPKLRPGGMLAGHDYMTGVAARSVFGVRAAVDKFARDHNLLLMATRDLTFPSFIIIKP